MQNPGNCDEKTLAASILLRLLIRNAFGAISVLTNLHFKINVPFVGERAQVSFQFNCELL